MKVQLKNGGQSYSLTNSDYIASGGEGKVYQKGGYAFKIYHDPKAKALPIGKLIELSKINLDNVLGPKDILLSNKGDIIGFVMKYVTDTVFLCWLFNKGYKDQNNIGGDILGGLVSDMRTTTIDLHNKGFVVGDFNEMNFLTGKDYGRSYFIDVDSYQTPNYPCTAIMDTVRDRLVPFGKFSTETDWFGYAVVTFQLWTGIHPYKGKHKDYDRQMVKQLKMMDDNISVFNKAVTLPKNALPLDVIPTELKRWYEGTFEHKQRDIPPQIGAVPQVLHSNLKIVQSQGNFLIEKLHTYGTRIQKVRTINGRTYVITKQAVHWNDTVLIKLSSNRTYDLCEPQGSYSPILVCGDHGTIEFWLLEKGGGTKIGTTDADHVMMSGTTCYTVRDKNVVLHKFHKKFNKMIHEELVIEYVSSLTSTVYEGVVMMDLFGKCFVAMPYEKELSCKINIRELDGHRIIDAKFVYHKLNSVLCVISEQGGIYHRTIEVFNSEMKIDSHRHEDSTPNERVNFTIVESSGTAVLIVEDHTLELFSKAGIKKIDNPPFDSTIPIYNDGAKVLITNNKELSKVSLK